MDVPRLEDVAVECGSAPKRCKGACSKKKSRFTISWKKRGRKRHSATRHDLRKIDSAASKITVQGTQYPKSWSE